ncbi:putative Pumilio-family RNA-binding protein [Giardia duodenalis]|uniref:Pumilio-family RNA-binding protein n=1 Tax=Giardia intestinalis (strain ATCC 50803 / WB clone C6) TaxID=184922 RepID=A8BK73_GIAIC|nr:putative Pumilio-family RNA-binding protein [Giardia intestinalis]KAE8301525.1 putative Pumilio-family RNA-binding protein [Giardia intestinalis]|eukprot:XP_001706474.1 Pumilio-family RNA-binding protein, putative [Giardia lamblia ATCC 50803]
MTLLPKHSLCVTMNVQGSSRKDGDSSSVWQGYDPGPQVWCERQTPILPPGLTRQNGAFLGDGRINQCEELEAIPRIGVSCDGELQFNDSARLTPIEQTDPHTFKLATPPFCYNSVPYSSPMIQPSSGVDYYSEPHQPAHVQRDPIPCGANGVLPAIPYPVDTNGFTPLCTNPPLHPALISYIPIATPTSYEAPHLSFPILSPPAPMALDTYTKFPSEVFPYMQDTVHAPHVLPYSLDADTDRTSCCSSPIFGMQSPVPTRSATCSVDLSQTTPQRITTMRPCPLSFTLTHSALSDTHNSTTTVFSNEPIAPQPDLPTNDYERKLVLSFKEPTGCKILQQYLADFPDKSRYLLDVFIAEYSTPSLMESLLIHPSGNYCFQKIIESSDASQRLRILLLIQDSLFDICQNLHGTRSIQKLFERVSSDEEKAIIAQQLGAGDRIIKLIVDINGNHCVQRCIETFAPKDCTFIYDQIIRELVLVGTHQHGCCIIQRCLDLCSEAQRVQIVTAIKNHVMELIVDRFGNYVFQYSLEKANNGLCGLISADDLIRPILGHEGSLVNQKFSSHAVEKCLKYGSRRMRTLITENLMASSSFLSSAMDKFGNYVVQKAFIGATDEQKRTISQRVLTSPEVLNCSYSRHLVQMCEKFANSHKSR